MEMVLVCGSRYLRHPRNVEYMRGVLHDTRDDFYGHTLLVGGGRGADEIAEQFWSERDWPIEVYPADWSAFGNKAGPMRNAQMIAREPSLVIAFPSAARSPGTMDTIQRAIAACIPVRIYPVRLLAEKNLHDELRKAGAPLPEDV